MTVKQVLADTSAWVEWLNKTSHAIGAKMDHLFEDEGLCVASVIKAELMRGAASERERTDIHTYWENLPALATSDLLWDEAGELAYKLRRKGITPGLIDCYLACTAMHYGVSLLTLDKGFEAIKQHSDLILESF